MRIFASDACGYREKTKRGLLTRIGIVAVALLIAFWLLVPFLTRFQINLRAVLITEGRVRYVDRQSDPPVDLRVSSIRLEGEDISSATGPEKGAEWMSRIGVSGLMMGEAPLKADLRINPLEQPPRFEFNGELRNLNLAGLNDLLRPRAGGAWVQACWISTLRSPPRAAGFVAIISRSSGISIF